MSVLFMIGYTHLFSLGATEYYTSIRHAITMDLSLMFQKKNKKEPVEAYRIWFIHRTTIPWSVHKNPICIWMICRIEFREKKRATDLRLYLLLFIPSVSVLLISCVSLLWLCPPIDKFPVVPKRICFFVVFFKRACLASERTKVRPTSRRLYIFNWLGSKTWYRPAVAFWCIHFSVIEQQQQQQQQKYSFLPFYLTECR